MPRKAAKATASKQTAKTEKPTSTKRKAPEEADSGTPGKSAKPDGRSDTSGTSSEGNLLSLIKDTRWKEALKSEAALPYFKTLQEQVLKDYADSKKEIFPPKDLIFNALNLTPMDKLSAVIIGQDPYHDNGQAHGLSFSVPHGVAPPPSLKNIYKELVNEGFKAPEHGCLEAWARRGVLLLNATLTVEAHKPNSHAKYGWQQFTDAIIRAINDNTAGVVFILWGGFAHKKEKLIDSTKHGVVKTAHPSPLSVNKFMKCNCFLDANDKLKKMGKKPIDWSLA